jgi:hypothetical protein
MEMKAAMAMARKKTVKVNPQLADMGQTKKTEMKKPTMAVTAKELVRGATRERWWIWPGSGSPRAALACLRAMPVG